MTQKTERQIRNEALYQLNTWCTGRISKDNEEGVPQTVLATAEIVDELEIVDVRTLPWNIALPALKNIAPRSYVDEFVRTPGGVAIAYVDFLKYLIPYGYPYGMFILYRSK